MHLLLTNDDGIDSPLLRRLTAQLRARLPSVRISVVVPDRERSGVAHAFTYRGALRCSPAVVEGCRAWKLSGMPADCVKLAVNHLLADDRPDLVLSGVNRGSNLGIAVV